LEAILREEQDYTESASFGVQKKVNPLTQLKPIIDPEKHQDEIRRNDKKAMVQRNLLERASSMSKLGGSFPNKKKKQNQLIYEEVFVAPKMKEVEKLKQAEADRMEQLEEMLQN
jgi:hypothetical protein